MPTLTLTAGCRSSSPPLPSVFSLSPKSASRPQMANDMALKASGAVTAIQHLQKVWSRIAPLQLADNSWDNVGVMIESPVPNPAHKQVLLTIDLTTSVCKEALSLPSCSLVVSYHPPIFRGLKSMTLSDPLQASLLKLSARGISVFSPHTSLDATPNGINAMLVEPWASITASSKPLQASDNVPNGFEGAGIGRIITLTQGITAQDAVRAVKENLQLEHVQLALPDDPQPIMSIAVCAGSGGSVFKGKHADLLVTGEMSHHEVLAAVARDQTVILCCHTNTERPYLSRILRPWLEKELNEDGESGWEVRVSKTNRDPLQTV